MTTKMKLGVFIIATGLLMLALSLSYLRDESQSSGFIFLAAGATVTASGAVIFRKGKR